MGLRLDVRKLAQEFERKRSRITASAFRPELKKFAANALTSAMNETPSRSLGKIQAAQTKQYHNRVSYIPSVHSLEDPTLIVNDAGEHWLFAGGKWYPASYRTLPAEIDAILSELETERDRRLSTPMGSFIAERAQARFLYKRAWFEAGQSLGIQLPAGSDITQSHSRHNPPRQPPKGYGQWRGGKNVISVVVFLPLLERPSRYIEFSAKDILAKATAAHYPDFAAEVAVKLNRLLVSK